VARQHFLNRRASENIQYKYRFAQKLQIKTAGAVRPKTAPPSLSREENKDGTKKQDRVIYTVSMSLFCLNHGFVYLLFFCTNWDRSKTNKQGCNLARKGPLKRAN